MSLHYGGGEKLITTATGIDVTGSVTCDGFTSTGIDDNANSTAITISAAEDVGINTTAPTAGYKLHVKGSSGAHAKMKVESTTATGQAELYLTANSAGGSLIHLGDEAAASVGRIAYYHADNDMRFETNGTEKARIQSGGGISFNGDTAAANALDDYEEGYWNPVVTGATSGTFTLNTWSDTLAYTKVGRVCHVQGEIGIGSGAVVGQINISLPFTTASLTDGADAIHCTTAVRSNGSTLTGQPYMTAPASSATVGLIAIPLSGTAVVISGSDVDTNWQCYVNFSYITA